MVHANDRVINAEEMDAYATTSRCTIDVLNQVGGIPNRGNGSGEPGYIGIPTKLLSVNYSGGERSRK